MDPYKKIKTDQYEGLPSKANYSMTTSAGMATTNPNEKHESHNSHKNNSTNNQTLGSIPQVDRESIKEDYKLLNNYKINLYKIDELILLETQQEKIGEYQNLKNDLEDAIREQMDKIKSVSADQLLFSVEILSQENKGRLCKAYYQKDDRWYHCLLVDIDVDEQEASIQFIGYQEIIKLHAIYIKLMPRPDPGVFQPGFQCEALYADDAHFYPCMIQSVTEDGKYVVKYIQYKNKDTVPLDFLRESQKLQTDNKLQRTFQNLDELKIPENLKILPNDSEQQRNAQKQKIKALKQSWKQAVIEKDGYEKQSSWQQFNNSAQQKKLGHFQDKRESIFKSPQTIDGKVGVMGSGQGMTNIDMRTKMNLTDNSHLSRLF